MREKQRLERELQHEHEEHANAIKQLSAVFSERVSERTKLKSERCQLENQLEAEQESIIHRLGAQIQALLTDRVKLKRDNERLRAQLRSLGVSRSVSPALSRGHPSPASSPRFIGSRPEPRDNEPPPAALHAA